MQQSEKGTESWSQFDTRNKRKWTSDGDTTSLRANKVARLSSGATMGAAIVEAENSLEIEVAFFFSRSTLMLISTNHFFFFLIKKSSLKFQFP